MLSHKIGSIMTCFPTKVFLFLLLVATHRSLSVWSFHDSNGEGSSSPRSTTFLTTEQERRLAIGDFADFNRLFGGAKVDLPDADVSRSGLKLRLRNMYCQDVQIGDIQTNFTTSAENDALTLGMFVNPFDFVCVADYSYSFAFFRGSGKLTARARNSQANLRVNLTTPTSFQLEPPDKTSVVSCRTKIEIYDLDFKGGIVARVLDLLEELVDDVVENNVEDRICKEMDSIETVIDGFLSKSFQQVAPYLEPVPSQLANPLLPESALLASSNVALLSLVDDPDVGNLLDRALGALDDFLSKETTTGDLAINEILRDRLLSDTGAFVVNMTDLPVDFNRILYAGHDRLTESEIILDAVRIYGLDSLQQFNPFDRIGNFTVSNQVMWKFLDVEIDLIVKIKPSTRDDALLLDPDPVQIVENIKVSFGFNNVQVELAFLLALDRQKLGSLELASVLDSKNVIGCFLSSVHTLKLSGFDFRVDSVDDPVLSGFVSPGIDRVISTFVEAVFLMYEPTFLRSLPHFFQDIVRKTLQEKAIDPLLKDNSEASKCPTVMWPSGSIDFRDLLLLPDEASQLGGSGKQPYGDLVNHAYKLVLDRITEPGQDGLPRINDMLLRPWTSDQSGVEGDLVFNSNLVALSRQEFSNRVFSDLVDSMEFRLGNVQVKNIDSVSFPLELLHPTARANIVGNKINIGNATSSPLSVSIRFFLSLEGTSSLNMANEIDLTASVDSLLVDTALSAVVDSTMISRFPLGDLLSMDCWLALFSLEDAQILTRSLSVDSFQTALDAFAFGVECVSCSNEGSAILPDLITIVNNDGGAKDILSERVPDLAKDLVEGEWFQSLLHRWTSDAPKRCKHRPEFQKDAGKSSFNSIDFPVMSPESFDTALYSFTLASWVAFVVFAESQRQNVFDDADPLSAQARFQVPDGVELIDWTNFGSSTGLGPTADTIMEQLRDFVGEPDDSGSIKVNSLVRGALDKSGGLSYSFGDAFYERGGLAFSIDKMTFWGLDSFESADVLQPVASQTLLNSASLRSLAVELDVTVGYEKNPNWSQEISIRLELEDIEASIALFAAFDMKKLRNLPIGAILQIDRIAPCLLSAMFDFQVPELSVSVGAFKNPVVRGMMETTSFSMNKTFNATVEKFGEELTEAIPRIFEGIVKEVVSGYVSSFTEDAACPPPIASSTGDAFVDFRDLLLTKQESAAYGGSGTSPYGDFFQAVFKYVKDNILAVDSSTYLSPINDALIRPLTESQSGFPGRLSIDGDLFNSNTRVNAGGLDARVGLRAYDVYADNLNTVGAPLSVLDPIRGEAYLLNNTISAGIGEPILLGGRFRIELLSEDSMIKNDFNINLSLHALTGVMTALIRVLESSFLGLPLEHIGNWRCWVAMLPVPELDSRGVRAEGADPSLSISQVVLSVAELGLNISCIECSGPDMDILSQRLSQPELAGDVTNVANDLLSSVAKLLEGEYVQVALDRLVADSRRQCPGSPDYEADASRPTYTPFESPVPQGDSIMFLVALLVAIASMGIGVGLLLLFIRLFVKRRHRKWLASLPEDRLVALARDQRIQDEKVAVINDATNPLFLSPQIPVVIRLATPFVIIGNIGFFLSGHLSLGGSVTIILSLAGESYVADKFFEFSMASSAIEIWNAGGKELAMLILIFSGIWPYTKQIITLFLWFAPPSLVSVTKRENILLWLDALAKWSMSDVFVLVMTLAAFRVSIQSPAISFLPDNFYSIDLLVVPKWGLYANMIAQLISQISSHFIIHYHRRVVEGTKASLEEAAVLSLSIASSDGDEEEKSDLTNENQSPDLSREAEKDNYAECLCDHKFARPHRGESDKLVPRLFVGPLLIGLLVLLSAFLVAGCSVPSYSLDVLGIVGILVESGQRFRAATSFYNVFETAGLLFEQAAFTGKVSDYFGLGTLAFLMTSTVLLVPLVQSVVLVSLWFQRLTEKKRHRLLTAVECLSAWQYAEVYFISVIVASWQLGPVSEYMINAYCGSLKDTFAELVFYGILKEEDAQCFRVNTHVETGLFLLAIGSILLAVLNTFVVKAARQAKWDNTEVGLGSSGHKLDPVVAASGETEDSSTDGSRIHPVPVLFSDTFRWFLVREPLATDLHEDYFARICTENPPVSTGCFKKTSEFVSIN